MQMMFGPSAPLLTGTVLRVNHGLYDHVGLLGPHAGRQRSVWSFSAQAGGYIEEPFEAFAMGRQVLNDGYFGRLPPDVVLQRARLMAYRPYSWVEFNCEHFVRFAHDVEVESPQLHRWAMVGGAGLLLCCAVASARS